MKYSLKHIAKGIGQGGLLIMLSFLINNQLTAQGSKNLGDDDEIIAVGSGTRIIKPSAKIKVVPKLIIDSTKKQIKTDYVFYEYTAPSEFKVEPIKPAKIKILDPLDKLKKGYLKAGIGMYLSPLVEAHYGSERTRHNNWGVNYNHFSSHQGINNVGFSGLSDNHGDVFYKHFFDHYSVRGDLYYDHNVNYFYGFNTEDTAIDKDLIRQRFQTIGGKAKIESYMQDIPQFNYNAEVGFRNYTDNYKARENNFLLTGEVQHIIDEELYGIDGLLDINGYKREEGIALNDTTTFQASSESTTNAIFSLTPKIITNRNRLKAFVGLNMAVNIGSKTKFHFYPTAEFKYSFLDIFIPYVGIRGGLTRNSFYSLSQENPFVLSDLNTRNTNTKFDIYGGVRGSVSKNITFNLQASNKRMVDLPLFVTDTLYSIENKFDVVYDTIDVFSLTGQLTYKAGDKLNVFGKATYNLYSPLNQQKAWNLPAVEVTIGGVYDLEDKILLKSDVFFQGTRKAKSLTFVEGADFERGEYIVNLPAFIDFNLGVEYRYTKQFSVFLNFNNIVSQKYRQYYKYPNQGLNILGGLTVKF